MAAHRPRFLPVARSRVDAARIVDTFRTYHAAERHSVSAGRLRQNLAVKMSDAAFLSDVPSLLRPGVIYDVSEARELGENDLIVSL